MEKRYEIGGQRYVQRPLVLGQLRALLAVLEGLELKGGMGALELIETIGDRLPRALAVVLVPEEMSVREAIVEEEAVRERELELDCAITTGQCLEVIEDFFGCNPVSSLLERLGGMLGRVHESMENTGAGARAVQQMLSSGFSSGSPAVTSEKESGSSGKPKRKRRKGGSK